jgi:hypothetical protein
MGDTTAHDRPRGNIRNAITKLIELTNRAMCSPTAPPRGRRAVGADGGVAPHLAEELWRRLGHADGVTYADFPTADSALLVTASVTYPLQVKGGQPNPAGSDDDADHPAG